MSNMFNNTITKTQAMTNEIIEHHKISNAGPKRAKNVTPKNYLKCPLRTFTHKLGAFSAFLIEIIIDFYPTKGDA